jgi:lipoprotein-anchoring transpeptidase ErfK/SrfK
MTRRKVRAATFAAILLGGCGDGGNRTAEVPEPPEFRPAADGPAEQPKGRWLTARLSRPVVVRATPAGRAVARVRPRTQFGSPAVLGVVRRHRAWLLVLTSERANGGRGWIPAARARLGGTDLSVHVDRSGRRADVRDGRRVVRRFPVAVGRPETPTPPGRYAVTDRLRTGRADSPYGCCVLALTGRQQQLLPGWPGGDRLALHGTPEPETIGRAASLGCIRVPEEALQWMMRTLPLGAPVFVTR